MSPLPPDTLWGVKSGAYLARKMLVCKVGGAVGGIGGGVVGGIGGGVSGTPPPKQKEERKAYLIQVWVPGVIRAPGPGNPAVVSIEFVPVAGVRKMDGPTPSPTFG